MNLQQYLGNCGLIFDFNDVINLHLSLKTSPLTILTGVSGSGKTKLAQHYVDYMCLKTRAIVPAHIVPEPPIIEKYRYRFVSVRSDWLDSKGLLGYYNPLLDIYYSTSVTELLIDAINEPTEPFFLILDEMNLSKAEYYFSDFLSALESRRKNERGEILSEPIQLHRAGHPVNTKSYQSEEEKQAAAERLEQLTAGNYVHVEHPDQREYFIPETIEIPPNVFVIGTVNIDETTYRFSPKIIDRSQVIEMSGGNIETYFAQIIDISTASSGSTYYQTLVMTIEDLTHNRSFIIPRSDADTLNIPTGITIDMGKIVGQLWGLLEYTPFRFSYRTTNRILHFVTNGIELLENSNITVSDELFNDLFDRALSLKILPRIYGPKRLIEELLKNLLYFCSTAYQEADYILAKEGKENNKFNYLLGVFNADNFRFPKTATRISFVLNSLPKTNYGSFI